MDKQSVKRTCLYAMIQFFYWFVFGASLAYASPYLLACGLSNTAIGLISASACALSALLQPALASYADREKSLSVKAILLLLSSAMALLGILLKATDGASAALSGVLLGGVIMLVQISLPFVNALATESVNAGNSLNFSIARGVGSIGYAVMSFAMGQWTARLGPFIEPWAIIAFSCCFLLALALFPFHKQGGSAPAQRSAADGAGAFIRRYPAFSFTLLGCVLIYISHILINNFLFQIVSAKGGTSEHMGIAMALAGILEIFSMFTFAYLLKWKGSGFWFRLSSVFFALKALGTLLAPSIGALYAVQLLQPLGWGLLSVASVYYVNEIMQPQDRIKGQAYMTMSHAAANIVGSLGGGWLIDAAGVNGMLLAAVVCGAAGALIVLRKKGKSSAS